MTNQDTSEARSISELFSYKTLNTLYKEAIELIFPPRCQHCGRVDTYFCTVCEADMVGQSLDVMIADIPPMLNVISTGLHTDLLQSGVQALKYSGQQYLGKLYAHRIKQALDTLDWEFDVSAYACMY